MNHSGYVRRRAANADIAAFLKAHDAAFNAKDLDKLAAMYHPEVTIFEGRRPAGTSTV